MDGKAGWKTVSQVIILWGEGTRRDLGAPLNYGFHTGELWSLGAVAVQ
jgi:hypothetical protein